VHGGVFSGEPRAEIVDEHGQESGIGRRYAGERGGGTHLCGALRVIAGEQHGGPFQVAGPAAPAGHDQGESGADQPAGDVPAKSPAAGVRAGFGGPGAPARQDQGQVTVRLTGQEPGRKVTRQLVSQVVPEQRGAQASDEEAAVVPFQLAERAARAARAATPTPSISANASSSADSRAWAAARSAPAGWSSRTTGWSSRTTGRSRSDTPGMAVPRGMLPYR